MFLCLTWISYISLLIARIPGSKEMQCITERDLGYQAQNPSFTPEEIETSKFKRLVQFSQRVKEGA